MRRGNETQGGAGRNGAGTIEFEASDVTGTHTVKVSDVQRSLPAGTLAKAIAARMALPDNVPWVLRDDTTSAFLEEDKPIGDQIGPDAKITITPLTHLG